MRVLFDGDDEILEYEDWREIEFHHAAWIDAPISILTGRTLRLDLTTNEARPEFSAWQETVRRD